MSLSPLTNCPANAMPIHITDSRRFISTISFVAKAVTKNCIDSQTHHEITPKKMSEMIDKILNGTGNFLFKQTFYRNPYELGKAYVDLSKKIKKIKSPSAAYSQQEFFQKIHNTYNQWYMKQCKKVGIVFKNEACPLNLYFQSISQNNYWPRKFYSNPVHYLKKIGYQPVTTSKVDDIAIYCLAGDQSIPFKHLGIVTNPNKVLSKWEEWPCLLEHKFHHVPLEYGDVIFFFRRPFKTVFKTSFLIQLDKTKEFLKDWGTSNAKNPSFNHDIYLYALESFKSQFKSKISSLKQEQSKELSIYKQEKKKFFDQLEKVKLKPDDSLKNVFKTLKKVVQDSLE